MQNLVYLEDKYLYLNKKHLYLYLVAQYLMIKVFATKLQTIINNVNHTSVPCINMRISEQNLASTSQTCSRFFHREGIYHNMTTVITKLF